MDQRKVSALIPRAVRFEILIAVILVSVFRLRRCFSSLHLHTPFALVWMDYEGVSWDVSLEGRFVSVKKAFPRCSAVVFCLLLSFIII